MPMIRNSFPQQMDKDIDKVYMDHYQNYPSDYEKIAKIENFPKGRYMTRSEISGLGAVEVISEGGRITFDTPVEGHRKQVEATKYGLGFQVTEEMVEDDYHGKVMQVPKTLAESAREKINVEFFSLFNDGNDVHTSWDGQFVFSNGHTTLKSGDTIDNLATNALSETTMQAAFEYFQNLVDEAGRKIYVKPDTLMVPIKLQWLAGRLARQSGGITGSADTAESSGNLMTTNPSNGFVDGWKVFVTRYLTDDETWFLVSSKDHQACLGWKKKPALQSMDDFHTDSRLYKVTTRFKPVVFDYKAMYGSFV